VAPSAFFEAALPRVLSTLRATCKDLGGRYAIEVEGHGAWTLDFPGASVRAGRAADADVTLWLSEPQFQSLTKANVELARVVADGTVRCEGDRAKIENVSLVLAFLSRG
jgi:alkyl sulfatase BDS1-like metallo-beta-lactamase superfamily hydrolase